MNTPLSATAQQRLLNEELLSRSTDALFVLFFFMPVAARLLLPISYEYSMTVNLGPLPVFLPELLWFVCPFLYRRPRLNIVGHRPVTSIAVIASICAFISLLTSMSAELYPMAAMISSMELFLLVAMVAVMPIQPWHEKPLLICLTMLVGLLSLEVILFSLGIMEYKLELSHHEYAGVSRISTTVGAATGTAHAIFLTGLWQLEIAMRRRARLLAFIGAVPAVIAIGLLVSRGPIAMVMFAAMLWLGRMIIARTATKKQKVRLMVSAGALAFVALIASWQIGVIDAVVARVDSLARSGSSLNRDQFGVTMSYFIERPWTGYGAGNYIVRKRFDDRLDARVGPNSPHNTYMQLAVENGVIVALVFLSPIVVYSIILWWKLPFSAGASGLLGIALLGMNVEIVYVEYEWSIPLMAMLCWMLASSRRAKGNSAYAQAIRA